MQQRRLAGRTPTLAAGAAEVNVTPVLNMFTILIPFLVTMTAFSHVAVQAFRLPSDEAPGQAQTLDSQPITIVLGVDGITVAHADRVLARLSGSLPDAGLRRGSSGGAGSGDAAGLGHLAPGERSEERIAEPVAEPTAELPAEPAAEPTGELTAELTVELTAALVQARQILPEVHRAVVAVDDPVRCGAVVACLDLCREAGFTDVGLAAGADR